MNYSFQSICKQNNKLAIDTHGANDGYFFAGITVPTSKRLKIRISKGNDSLTYDLKNDGTFEMFPFQFGSGIYQIILYQNVYDKKYMNIGVINLNVTLKNKNAAFLIPNPFSTALRSTPRYKVPPFPKEPCSHSQDSSTRQRWPRCPIERQATPPTRSSKQPRQDNQEC